MKRCRVCGWAGTSVWKSMDGDGCPTCDQVGELEDVSRWRVWLDRILSLWFYLSAIPVGILIALLIFVVLFVIWGVRWK